MSAAGAIGLSNLPILLVVGDDRDHGLLDGILQPHCQMHRATARQEAVTLLRQHRPKVVICDQVFADGDWRDLLRDLECEPDKPRLIVSSRLADDRLWAEVLNLGGYDLLTKPFAACEVSRVVQMAFRHSDPDATRAQEERSPSLKGSVCLGRQPFGDTELVPAPKSANTT